VAGTLFVVATPIGNLADLTYRAESVLSSVDIIAAEDTRTSGKLLKHHNIHGKMISYHEHNELPRSEQICEELLSGKNVALITDAGTPAISDPGYRLVHRARKLGIPVVAVPGPSSVTAALSVSGLPSDQFYFTGFLPRRKGRKTRLEMLAALPATVIIFESPVRLVKTLADLEKYMGNRVVSACRELTKMYEEVITRPVSEVRRYFEEHKPRGEFVLIVAKEGYEW